MTDYSSQCGVESKCRCPASVTFTFDVETARVLFFQSYLIELRVSLLQIPCQFAMTFLKNIFGGQVYQSTIPLLQTDFYWLHQGCLSNSSCRTPAVLLSFFSISLVSLMHIQRCHNLLTLNFVLSSETESYVQHCVLLIMKGPDQRLLG